MSANFDARSFLAQCSTRPGVYRMLDADGQVLYVGKARDLKARLSSYFRSSGLAPKTRALVARISSISTTVTQSEVEALLLEQGLIKELKPPYNVLLRDDKSYPFIQLTDRERWPRIGFHRGTRRKGVRYFGPYPSSGAVRETLALVEKVFQLRNCRDSFFRNRTRPCLQHQINRCTAPCVGYVTEAQYRAQVDMATAFLEGRDQQITDRLTREMEQASAELAFERAAGLRDQITAIRHIQERQYVDTGRGNVDVVALASAPGLVVIEVLFIRQGRVLGNRSWVPNMGAEDEAGVMRAFLEQYYLGEHPGELPGEVLLAADVGDTEALAEAIRQKRGKRARFASRVRGERQAWMRMATENARQSLVHRLAARESLEQRYLALAALLGEDTPPARIECFDISHTGGERAVASCVVFGTEGPRRADYRRFNVEPESGGDDYAALAEAVSRRYRRVQKEQGELPGLLLIDGGKGQVGRIASVLEELGLTDQLPLLGIAKGPSRKAGLEVLWRADGTQLAPAADNPGLHLLQHVRDEAHRFAIAGHRGRRSRPRSASTLEEIPGVGAKRRKALLTHFGGLAQLRDAPAEAIAQVPGVSPALAQTVYDWLHEG
mgnify:CR=1 FL=1